MAVFVKRRDGSISAYRNAEFIPAYLIIPESSLSRCPKELWLPRTVRSYFFNWDVIDVVESDLFLELIIDAYAYLTWPYLGINDYMENYSGYDPVWDIAHNPTFWIQTMTDLRLIPTTEYLYQHGIHERMGFVADWEMNELLEQTIPVAFERYNLGVVIETAQAIRCPEDYDARNSKAKIDFYRKWYHTRSKHAEISLEAWNEERREKYNAQDYDIPDAAGDLEREIIAQVDTEQFLAGLKEKDRQILQLRMEGFALEEIAARLGYKNHSGVLKRINKIGEAYQRFARTDLGFNLQSRA